MSASPMSAGPMSASTIPALMFMGTGSNVGKSTIVAGLCRALKRRGFRVVHVTG